jgi:arylsulfatase A-like enzyme
MSLLRSLRLLSTAGAALSASCTAFSESSAASKKTAERAADPRPNFVVFVADDLGATDLGCYGSTFYETPHLDQLARDGARFTAAYAACPVCSPSRASLLTGRWPQRTGVTDYIGAPVPENWDRNTPLLPARYAPQLALEEITLAEALKAAGYPTFFAGKWHLGGEAFWPERQGFDFNFGGTDKGGPYGGKGYFSPYANKRLTDGPPGEHLPDRLASEAARFIANHREKPFLVYLPFYDVHTPLQARADLLKKYEDKRRRLGLETRWGREEPREIRLTQDLPVYAAMVEAMDQAVGKVLAALDEHGLRENTLVIFTSDNGGLATGEYSMSNGLATANAPLRAGKGWLYEGGVREPFIARWPAKIKAGATSDAPVSSPDLMPTLLAAAGASAPAPLDGADLAPLFAGGKFTTERALFWHYPHYGNQGGAPGAAIRRGAWKLIEWFEDDRVELFDLARDPGETANLAASEPQRVEVLRAELHAWQKEVGAQFPTRNPRHDPSQPSGRASKFSPRPQP